MAETQYHVDGQTFTVGQNVRVYINGHSFAGTVVEAADADRYRLYVEQQQRIPVQVNDYGAFPEYDAGMRGDNEPKDAWGRIAYLFPSQIEAI